MLDLKRCVMADKIEKEFEIFCEYWLLISQFLFFRNSLKNSEVINDWGIRRLYLTLSIPT